MRICLAAGRSIATALLCGAALGMSACAQSNPPPLPDLKPASPDAMMTPAQQHKAIEEMAAKKSAEEADALKKIQETR